MSEIMKLQLPDGQEIWARVSGAPGARDIGFGEAAGKARAAVVEDFSRLIDATVDNLRGTLERYEADEASVAFGIEFTVKSGQVLSVLTSAAATASVTVNLTWKKRPDGDAGDVTVSTTAERE